MIIMPKTERKKSKKSVRFLEKRSQKTMFGLTYEELYNIVVCVFVTSLILAYNPVTPAETFEKMPRALFSAAIAFLIHLSAQKIMAGRLACSAFYRLWLPGLVVSMLLMVVGIKPILLIGAVSLSAYKFGRFGYKGRQMTMTEIGWIGVVGPAANIVMAYLFKIYAASTGSSLLYYMAMVNGLMALFNLVPIKPLDGSKVVLWNPMLWIFLVFILLLILTPSGLINYFTAPYIG